MKICAVYKITNIITNDFYIGSSNNIKRRWKDHKCKSTWNKCPNNPMYLDMKKYGVDKFEFEIIAEAEVEQLKEKEQQFIETLKPTYNNINAKGLDIERQKEHEKSEKGKETHRKASKKYDNQLCLYNGQTLTLNALRKRFWKAGIPHPTVEAKKYLLQ